MILSLLFKLYDTCLIPVIIYFFVSFEGSEGFKWGAITGALIGGGTETSKYSKAMKTLKGTTLNGLTTQEAAAIQMESGFPIDVIASFKSMEEYNIYKNAGLYSKMIDGKISLVRDIDLKYQSKLSEQTVTNLERMKLGFPPIDPTTGEAYQLHHINQEVDGTLAILTKKEHLNNSSILNEAGKTGVHNESQLSASEWAKIKRNYWKDFAKQLGE